MGGIAVPGFQRQHLAHLVAHEIASRFETRIEALHVADLQDLPDTFTAAASSSTSSTDTPTGFSHSTCLPAASARFDTGTWKASEVRDDHRIDLGIGQHRIIVEIGL